jgi:hypothetical protein
MLRRANKNNFIFQVCQFDSIDELITKYRLKPKSRVLSLISYLRQEWKRFDIIEFILDIDRNIEDIIFYEVKTKLHTVHRDYFEICKSNKVFLDTVSNEGWKTKIISIILFENWRFSFTSIPYHNVQIRTYSNHKK